MKLLRPKSLESAKKAKDKKLKTGPENLFKNFDHCENYHCY